MNECSVCGRLTSMKRKCSNCRVDKVAVVNEPEKSRSDRANRDRSKRSHAFDSWLNRYHPKKGESL